MVEIALAIIAALAIVSGRLQRLALTSHLREFHPDFYKSHGRPGVFRASSTSLGTDVAFNWYIVSGSYLRDKIPEECKTTFRIVQWCYIVGIGAVIVLLTLLSDR